MVVILSCENLPEQRNNVLFQFMEFFNEQMNQGRSIWAVVVRKRDSVPRRQIPTEDGCLYICDYFSPYVCIGKQYYANPSTGEFLLFQKLSNGSPDMFNVCHVESQVLVNLSHKVYVDCQKSALHNRGYLVL